jgi:hypothetical protein
MSTYTLLFPNNHVIHATNTSSLPVSVFPPPPSLTASAHLQAPAPSALMALSPLPGATTTPSGSPSAAAASGRSFPTNCAAHMRNQ